MLAKKQASKKLRVLSVTPFTVALMVIDNK